MNSSLADSGSLHSSYRPPLRSPDAVGRLKPNRGYFYLWLFGQMHVKRLLVSLQLILAIVALCGLLATVKKTDKNVLGIDNESASFLVEMSLNDPAVAREFLSWLSYYYLISVVLALLGIRLVERVWRNWKIPRYCIINPALFLVPFLFSMLSFAAPLAVGSYEACMTVNLSTGASKESERELGGRVFVATRLTFLPLILIWLMYLYLLYGAVLGFVYIWRRCNNWADRRKDTATASLSWVKIYNLNGHPNQSNTAPNNNNNNRRSRWSLRTAGSEGGENRKLRKSTNIPTLKRYESKGDDLNNSKASLLSGVGGEFNTSLDSRTIQIESVSVGVGQNVESPRPVQRSIAAYSVQRHLDTVNEEGESQEGTFGSHDSRFRL